MSGLGSEAGRTVIANGTVATATLENFRFRDKILCKQLVRLRYDLSPDHLRFVLAQIRDVLYPEGTSWYKIRIIGATPTVQ